MPAGFNGSGGYVRAHNWVADRNASIKILAERMDEEFDAMATAFGSCILKDGQQDPTDNLPMATFRITGMGDPVDAQDAATKQWVLDQFVEQTDTVSSDLVTNDSDVTGATVSDALENLLELDGSKPMTGDLDMDGNDIIDVLSFEIDPGAATNALANVRADSGQFGLVNFTNRADSLRWAIGKDDTAEAGSDAGSDLIARAYDDAGASLGDAFVVTRATRKTDFKVAPSSSAAAAAANDLVRKSEFDAAIAAAGLDIIESNTGTVTSGLTNFAHGLGSRPTFFFSKLRCKTIDLDYAVGDEIMTLCPAISPTGASGGYYTHTTSADTTNVTFDTDGTIIVAQNNTTGGAGITYANWDLILGYIT
jgi:hypothetical protein